MGIFDRIIKNVVSDAIGKEIEKHIPTNNNNYQDESYTNNTSPITNNQSEVHDKAYFAGILANNFSQYEVKENVSVSEIGGNGRPYDFGLYSGAKLAAVLVLTEHNRDNNRAYLGSKETAKSANIPFINFYLHMPNEKTYVIDRINKLIR